MNILIFPVQCIIKKLAHFETYITPKIQRKKSKKPLQQFLQTLTVIPLLWDTSNIHLNN